MALALFIATLFLLVSCKKPVDPNNPNPGPGPMPGLSHAFQFSLDSLPGQPNAPVANLFAQIDVKNEQNELVLVNKKLAISFDGKFKTEELKLPAGNYRISKLFIVSGTGNLLYAVPVINSVKANAVAKPLPYTAILPHPVTLTIAATVLKVETTDKAFDFGYAAEDFPTDNKPGENGNLSIHVKVAIKVGEIMYDSIPASLMYRTFDANNQLLHVKFISLAAGVNTVQLSETAALHELSVRKWNVDYKREISKTEVRKDVVYVFGGEKEAKKLKSELVYKWNGEQYKADSKISYFYGGKGNLEVIEYYQRRSTDNSPYRAKREVFQYNGSFAEKINEYDENDKLNGFTAFGYNGNGKVNSIIQDAGGVRTDVAVTYHPVTINGIAETSMHFTYSNTSILMDYYQRWKDGNCFSENSKSGNNNTETATYDYDQNINPYAHMNRPDLFLSYNSKNNITVQQRTYYGSYPASVIYSFGYKYDDEGYPVELIRRYKSYLTGEHLFTTKTVYTY